MNVFAMIQILSISIQRRRCGFYEVIFSKSASNMSQSKRY